MDIFAKQRYAFWTIVLLVVLNLVAISALWLGRTSRPGGPPPDGPPGQDRRMFLQKELNFTDDQIHRYDRLRQDHADKARVLLDDIRRLKKEMMDHIYEKEPDSTKAMQIADLIGQKQTELERITFRHFADLKELCGKEQLDKLRELMDEFFRRNPPEGRGSPPPPR